VQAVALARAARKRVFIPAVLLAGTQEGGTSDGGNLWPNADGWEDWLDTLWDQFRWLAQNLTGQEQAPVMVFPQNSDWVRQVAASPIPARMVRLLERYPERYAGADPTYAIRRDRDGVHPDSLGL